MMKTRFMFLALSFFAFFYYYTIRIYAVRYVHIVYAGSEREFNMEIYYTCFWLLLPFIISNSPNWFMCITFWFDCTYMLYTVADEILQICTFILLSLLPLFWLKLRLFHQIVHWVSIYIHIFDIWRFNNKFIRRYYDYKWK